MLDGDTLTVIGTVHDCGKVDAVVGHGSSHFVFPSNCNFCNFCSIVGKCEEDRVLVEV
jgi:MinD superfamily P-loop ATPase